MVVTLAAGCPATSEEVQPDRNQLYFPTGLVLSPDEKVLFVTNANADLRYDSGTLAAVDLDVVEAIARPWIVAGTVPTERDCAADPSFRETLVCDESQILLGDATVRIGNFAGLVQVQTLTSGVLRLFALVRGDPSVTWADFDPATRTMVCGGTGSFPRCDAEHRMSQLRDDLDLLPLSSEPFGLHVDGVNGYLVVAHLTTGNVTLATAPPGGESPLLVDVKGGFFEPRATGVRGAVAVAGRRPGTPNDLIYVTSRSESRVQTLTVVDAGGTFPTLAPTEHFFLRSVYPADDSRDLAFSDSGDRAYILNRNPASLVVVDTSVDATGKIRNEVVGVVEVCAQAAIVTVADLGQGERAYVSCFQAGQVWVIDTVGLGVEAIIDVGRGPHVLVAARTAQLLYVANFLDDNIAVVDLAPAAPTENRVVLRIGRRRDQERP
jgi:DNA-binding beta-propeller fold protein YncE